MGWSSGFLAPFIAMAFEEPRADETCAGEVAKLRFEDNVACYCSIRPLDAVDALRNTIRSAA